MTARETYNAAVKTAVATQAVTVTTNQTVAQTTIDAQRSAVGYTLQTGTMSSLQNAVNNANKAKFANDLAAEHAKQVSIAVARDTLKNTGDLGPA